MGTIQTSNGNNLFFNIAATSFGTLAVGNGTTVTLTGGLTQTGGTTVSDGTIVLGAGQNLDVQGGQLAGTGSVSGMVTNSGGTVQPGNALAATPSGTLTINGSYSQAGPERHSSTWVGQRKASRTAF